MYEWLDFVVYLDLMYTIAVYPIVLNNNYLKIYECVNTYVKWYSQRVLSVDTSSIAFFYIYLLIY